MPMDVEQPGEDPDGEKPEKDEIEEGKIVRNRWSRDEDRQLVELITSRGVPGGGKWGDLEGIIPGALNQLPLSVN